TDSVHRYRREIQLKPIQGRFIFNRDVTAGNSTDVKARPTHITDDHRVRTDQFADVFRSQNASDRTRDHGLVKTGIVHVGESSVGEHRLYAVRETLLLSRGFDF